MSFPAEHERSVRSSSRRRRDHVDPGQSRHNIGVALSEPQTPPNLPLTAGVVSVASQSSLEVTQSPASSVDVTPQLNPLLP